MPETSNPAPTDADPVADRSEPGPATHDQLPPADEPGPAPAPADAPTAPRTPVKRGPRKAAAPRGPRTSRAGRAAAAYDERPWLTSYPPGVPSDHDVPDVPLTRLLDEAAGSFPDHVALAFLGGSTTYRELLADVDRCAAALAGLGVGKGDRVALVLPNCPQHVIALFATLRLGAIVVEHNPLFTAAELRRQLTDCGATVVVCLDAVYGTVAAARTGTRVEHVVTTSLADWLPVPARTILRLPLPWARRARAELMSALPAGAPVEDLRRLLKADDPGRRQTPIEPRTDLALVQYTAGTTGVAKGALLTHRNLVSQAWINRLWDTEAQPGKEVTLCALPLFHACGLAAMIGSVLLGGTLVLLPRVDPDLVFAAVDRWAPTLLPGVPPLYRALAAAPQARDHDLRRLRLCLSSAMALPPEVVEDFGRLSGARLVESYGLTEAGSLTHATPTTGPRRPGSIGLPLPGTRVKLVAPDDPSVAVPVGAVGELAITGPQVCAGYWGRADQRGVFTEDGYLLTGDLAVMDQGGWFTLVGRTDQSRPRPPARVATPVLEQPPADAAELALAPTARDVVTGDAVRPAPIRRPRARKAAPPLPAQIALPTEAALPPDA